MYGSFFCGDGRMKKLIAAALLLAPLMAHADAMDDAVVSGVRAYQAAKCMSYLELADNTADGNYGKLSQIYSENVSVYIDNALKDDFKLKANTTTIPIHWFILVYGNRLDKSLLAGRLLQWTSMIETEKAGDQYSPNTPTIPESAGVAAFNNQNCVLLLN